MSKLPAPFERIRRMRGWLIPTALLALAPKCVLCLAAYAGMGVFLGFDGPEICGRTNNATSNAIWILGFVLAVVGTTLFARRFGRHA